MNLSDIILHLAEGYEDDLSRSVKDALVALKITGVKEVSTQKVLDDFTARGIKISVESLINMLQNDPIISDISKDKIVFGEKDSADATKDMSAKANDQTVSQMANAALKKRMGENVKHIYTPEEEKMFEEWRARKKAKTNKEIKE